MKTKQLKIGVMLLLNVAFMGLNAQEVMPATGGNASGSGGSVSYTTGQVACQTLNGTNGYVTEGSQQPYEIYIVTAIDEAKNITLSFAVYPNPASNFLQLKLEGDLANGLSYHLYDMQGKLIQNRVIENNITNIELEGHTTTAYLVKVYRNNQEIKTFKIIKK